LQFGKRERGENLCSDLHLQPPDTDAKIFSVEIQMQGGTQVIHVDINGVNGSMIVDTGSDVSIIQPGVVEGNIETFPLNHLELILREKLLGKSLDSRDSDLARKNAEASALTVFAKGKDGQNLPLQCEKDQVHMESLLTDDSRNTVERKDRICVVKHEDKVILEPRTPQITSGIVEDEQGQKTPPLFCIELAETPTEGRKSTQTVSQVTSTPGKKRKVSKNPKGYTCVVLTDISDERLTIPISTVVGLAEEAIGKLNPRRSIKTSDQN
jgi:hypothetical protein